MFKIYLATLKNFSFHGRATRKEYLAFAVFQLLAILLITLIVEPLGAAIYTVAYVVFLLATLIQGSAVSIRRLHDIGLSGWWILLSLVPLIGWLFGLFMLIKKGTEEGNKYDLITVSSEPKAYEPLVPS